jgi:methylated-DNA-[protein]-cysteine S-methyltransferase
MLFDTAIGRCAIAWGTRGIAAIQLPEADDSATRSRVLQRFPDARDSPPSPAVARTCDILAGLLSGMPGELASVRLDMHTQPPFHRRVYEAARAIPWGATTTYGALAKRVGAIGSARAVGQALARNPFAIIVPCHRVVAAGGKTGGFSAHGGAMMKLRLLAIEGHETAAQDKSAPGLFDGPCVAVKERSHRLST